MLFINISFFFCCIVVTKFCDDYNASFAILSRAKVRLLSPHKVSEKMTDCNLNFVDLLKSSIIRVFIKKKKKRLIIILAKTPSLSKRMRDEFLNLF
jgi:hypothetical protein